MSIGIVDWQGRLSSQYPDLSWQNEIGLSTNFESFSQHYITIISDARIDNYNDLCSSLQLSTTISTPELCWHLYQKHGNDCFDNIYGDFGIIIIDQNKQKIVAATDLFGIRPIFYAFRPNDFFVFSFALKPIVMSNLVSKKPDDDIVFSFLQKSHHVPPTEHTFYEHIKTIKAGHFLEVDPQCSSQHFYWHIPKINAISHEIDYSLIFKELLFESVKNRSKKYDKIASQLSGGLDSSSVTATLSAISPHKTIVPIHVDTGHESTNEKKYIEKLKEKIPFEVRYLRPSASVYDDTVQQIDTLAIPSNYILPFSFYKSSYDLAQSEGLQVMFTGHDGDSVVGYGRSCIEDLIQKQDWHSLKNYLENSIERDLTPIFGKWTQWDDHTKYIYTAQWTILKDLKQIVKDGTLFSKIKILHHEFNVPYTAIFNHLLTKIRNVSWANSLQSESILSLDFQQKHANKVLETFTYFNDVDAIVKAYLEDNFNDNFFRVNQETTLMARAFGFEIAHPFEDRQLVEFCMFVPEKIRFGPNGLGRMPLREAMKGLLPDDVRLRRSKAFFDEYGLESVNKMIAEHSLDFESMYIDTKKLHALIKEVKNEYKQPFFSLSRKKKQLMQSYFLQLWLSKL